MTEPVISLRVKASSSSSENPKRRAGRAAAAPQLLWWSQFHHLWTKAVGTPDYVKAEWIDLENALVRAGASPGASQQPEVEEKKDVVTRMAHDG